ncbi:hypothetical protein BOX15_Mlig024537g1 [Macrostomum lignano]|uniref:Nuclear pore complex protein NUP96 C-terminal domain-containing protein n=2 Tax=Macrostomum lignano TaxID=282301 RepID=A0A267DWT2_9PLAT|nr:hypothetical protein BOX15_Mlig024537g1 [Macrostomum lignano]
MYSQQQLSYVDSRRSFLASPTGLLSTSPSPSKLRRTGQQQQQQHLGPGLPTQSPLRVKPMEFAFAPESPVPSSMPARPAARLRFPESVKLSFAGYGGGGGDLRQCAADFSLADVAFWRSRSRRVSWGPSGELLAIDGPRIHLTSVFAPESSREASVHEENLLNAALDTSVSDRGSQQSLLQCPRWSPEPGLEPLTQYLAELESQPDSVLSRLLSLTRALWAPLKSSTVASSDAAGGEQQQHLPQDEFLATQLPRKEAFTEWVQRRPVVAELQQQQQQQQQTVEDPDSEGDCAVAVFRLLSAGQFTEACALALKRRHYRLALLLGQPHSESVRDLVAQQVACWQQTGAKDFIPPAVWRLYRLLAGDVNGTEGMDWTRAFTLYLWFSVPYGDGLGPALRAYKSAFKSPEPGAPPPPLNPEHGGARWDTAYHLVRLHCKRSHRLARLLDPRGYGPDPIDFGPAWHLWRSLRAIGYSHLTDSATQALHCGYAAKLESQGLWDWALFVLLHIDDDLARTRAVSACLSRHLGTVRDPALQNFLTNQLGLSRHWLHSAWALACRTRCFYISDGAQLPVNLADWQRREARHWLAAGQWRPAHDILLNSLAPRWLVAGQLSRVRRHLAPVARLAGDRQDWQLGGQLYLDFLQLLDRLDSAETDRQLEPEEAQASLTSLCSRVAALPSATVLQRVCQTELAQRCAHLLRQLLAGQPDKQAALLGQLSGLCCPLRCADCLLHGLLLKSG